jgi:hypothetical protein
MQHLEGGERVRRWKLVEDAVEGSETGALLTSQQPQDELWYDFFRELAGAKYVVAAGDKDRQIVRADVGFGDELSGSLATRIWIGRLHYRRLCSILPQDIAVDLYKFCMSVQGNTASPACTQPRLC